MRFLNHCKCLILKNRINHQHLVRDEESGLRLDIVLAKQIHEHSRAQIQTWIKDGCVTLNNSECRISKTKVQAEQVITLAATITAHSEAKPEHIALQKVYEDNDLIVINKPAGLVVHPGAGNASGTLMNALLYDCPNLAVLPRAGIIHRLDKDTTGLMMIAKHFDSYHALTQLLAERKVQRQYIAIVDGNLKAGTTIDQPIGRHPSIRQKMAVGTGDQAKEAVTHVSLLQRLKGYTLIQANLETGRTHQIRVHLQSIGHPLLGDHTYGKHKGYQQLDGDTAAKVLSFTRQALHAQRLQFQHPITGETCQFTAKTPDDMQAIIDCLSNEASANHH